MNVNLNLDVFFRGRYNIIFIIRIPSVISHEVSLIDLCCHWATLSRSCGTATSHFVIPELLFIGTVHVI